MEAEQVEEPVVEEPAIVDGTVDEIKAPESNEVLSSQSHEELTDQEPPQEETEEPTSWIDDSVRQLAAGYGLGDEDLEVFDGREDLDKYTLLLSKAFKAPEEPAKEEDPEPEPPPESSGFDPLDPALFEEYGDNEKKLVDHQNALASKLRELDEWKTSVAQNFEQQQLVQEQEAYWESFQTTADTLNEETFGRWITPDGKAAQVTEAQDKNREKLWNAIEQVDSEMERAMRMKFGNSADVRLPPLPVRMQAAEQRAFGSANKDQEKARLAAEQSKRRRPANSTAASRSSGPPPEAEDETEADAILRDPEWRAALKKFYAANG